jgi:hypothetical protein
MKTIRSKFAELMPIALLAVSTMLYRPSSLMAQGTAFTYQGVLNANGVPVTGPYDFTFNLFATEQGGTPVVLPGVATNGLGVTNGLFMVKVDFGAVFTGPRFWLEIGSHPDGSGSFQIMQPRVELTPVPYAMFAETTGHLANNSVTAANIVPLQMSGNLADAGIVSVTNSDGGGYGVLGINTATGIGGGVVSFRNRARTSRALFQK